MVRYRFRQTKGGIQLDVSELGVEVTDDVGAFLKACGLATIEGEAEAWVGGRLVCRVPPKAADKDRGSWSQFDPPWSDAKRVTQHAIDLDGPLATVPASKTHQNVLEPGAATSIAGDLS